MKQILVLGARIETSDEIADAVIDLAERLAYHGMTERIDFPCVVDGAVTSATILLGEPYTLATVRVPGSAPGELEDSAAALEELHRRTAELAPI